MRRSRAVAICAVAVAIACSGCGGSDAPAARTNQNPAADQLQAIVASFDLTTGKPRRFLLGLAAGDGRLIGFGTIEVRIAPADRPTGAAQRATFLPVPTTQVPDPMPSAPTLVDPVRGRGVYATTVEFDQPGVWNAAVDADVQGLGRVQATTSFQVNTEHEAIAVGERAPASKNYTLTAHGDASLAAVDSRAQNGAPVPDAALHRTTIASALAAKRPVVIAFSTPVYCRSQFCGPITDMIASVAKDYADDVDFVHVEIYRDFEAGVVNDVAFEWLQRIPGGDVHEPWVYVVDANGKVAARFDNVTTRDELVAALDAVT